MTTIIPTIDLVGTIADALHFITPDKDDDARRCVHLRWDGNLWHASATDTIHVAVSSWSPDDRPDQDEQHELGVELGGGDPWEFLLHADDAAHLLATAKPIKNLEHVPLYVDVDGDQLTVKRAKQPRVPGFSLGYDTVASVFPDLRQVVVDALGAAEPTKELWFNAQLLADFGKVRQRGCAAKLTLAGPDKPAVVEIGDRFVGAIMPVRNGDDPAEG